MSLLSATAIYGMCTDHTEVTLACGIFGQINKYKQGKFNFPAFTTLGIANDSRGGDSCGIFIDGKTEYGVEKTKLFSNFMSTSNLLKTTKTCHIALGHCRKASIGSIDLQRAQPVVLKNDNDEIEYVVLHNGTIHNYKELAQKYIPNIDIKDMSDSQVMARIFYYTGFDVLSEYNGGAVFVIVDYRHKEPVIYAFKGSSKVNTTSQINTTERPFYFTTINNSLYFSSIYEWLQPFTTNTIFTISDNVVVQIKNNDVHTHQIIDRSNCIQTAVTKTYTTPYSYTCPEYDYYSRYTTFSKTSNNATNGQEIKPNVHGLYELTYNHELIHGSYYIQLDGKIGYAQGAMYLSFWHGLLLKNKRCFDFLENFSTKSEIQPNMFGYIIPQTLELLSFHPTCEYRNDDYFIFERQDLDKIEVFQGDLCYIADDYVYIIENGIIVDCKVQNPQSDLRQLYTENLSFKVDTNKLNEIIIKECEKNNYDTRD